MQHKDRARERRAYIIRNGRMDAQATTVDRKVFNVTGRAIETMIYYSGYNDALRIYSTAQRDRVDYNLAYIEQDFKADHPEEFDQNYMRALFEYGYEKALQGRVWHKEPPILRDTKG